MDMSEPGRRRKSKRKGKKGKRDARAESEYLKEIRTLLLEGKAKGESSQRPGLTKTTTTVREM